MPRAARGPAIGVLVALGLVVTGIVVYATGQQPVSFGWFGYAPLSGQAPRPVLSGGVVWSHREVVGAALAASGIATGTGVVGYLLGRRHAARA